MWSNMWSSSFFDHLDLRGKCLYRRRIKGLRSRYFPAWRGSSPLPKQARYQLRYTRLFSCFILLVVFTQMWRGTNCATPGYLVFVHYITKLVRLKYFSVCGHSCSQNHFYTVFGSREKSRFRPCSKNFRAYVRATNGYSPIKHDTISAALGYSIFACKTFRIAVPVCFISDLQESSSRGHWFYIISRKKMICQERITKLPFIFCVAGEIFFNSLSCLFLKRNPRKIYNQNHLRQSIFRGGKMINFDFLSERGIDFFSRLWYSKFRC